jgi:hypothetical protein
MQREPAAEGTHGAGLVFQTCERPGNGNVCRKICTDVDGPKPKNLCLEASMSV